MNTLTTHLEPDSELVEFDPSGRYGRYNEVLGKGASKTVYRGFDEYDGIEVAWNQVKLHDFLQSPEDLERLYCEIHLLKTLKHQNIMKFYTSWVDPANRNINFVTEIFTSGTLRQYRKKHKRVNIRAVKHWCRQILRGLLYLHSHDPPVIHRDLKCDNIFVNGNHGEVKIGDLGLAAILRKSHAAHCVGTPEFMAPEVYKEEYNELVDIYSFGMCILEMVTFEYPYSECNHPAQIYKKVISGQKPDALYKVEDTGVRQFVEKCLATVSLRLSARELLNDPFLQTDDCEPNLRLIECQNSLDHRESILRQPFLELDYEGVPFGNGSFNGHSNGAAFDSQNGWEYHPTEIEQNGIEMFDYNDDEHDENSVHLDITIKGKMRKDGSIFLRLRITDKEGRIRNIYFPFDIEMDTALSVATEMVGELDITDQDVTNIADMIDGEIASLVPEWRIGPGYEETPRFDNSMCYHNCFSNHTSTGSFMNFLSNNARNAQNFPCCGNECASNMHGRFEEITYQVDSPRQHGGANKPVLLHHQTTSFPHTEIWDQRESLECSSLGSGETHSIEEQEDIEEVVSGKGNKVFIKSLSGSYSLDAISSLSSAHTHHEIQQELRWLKAKYQMELSELRDQQVGLEPYQSSTISRKHENMHNGISAYSLTKALQGNDDGALHNSSAYSKYSRSPLFGYVLESCPVHSITRRAQDGEVIIEFPNDKDKLTTAMKLNSINEAFLPNGLHRTTSLPVDAVFL